MVCGSTCLVFPQHAANSWVAASSILWVFCFVKPEDAEAFRDRFARNCPRRLIGTTEPKTMNAPYRDQSMKVTVHFAPCEDGGLMVWSERWRGLTQSTS